MSYSRPDTPADISAAPLAAGDFRHPVVFARDGEAFTSSRDVAIIFDKRHDHVLRDIDNLLKSMAPQNWGANNNNEIAFFAPSSFSDVSQPGREFRSFDMTRDGFMLLAMGFTGEKALRWKLAYLNAFNAMEAELRKPAPRKVAADPALVADVVMLRSDLGREADRYHRVAHRVLDEMEKMADAHERMENQIAALVDLRADILRESANLATLRADLAADQRRPLTQPFRRKPGRPPKFN